jgi:hypothetical protein
MKRSLLLFFGLGALTALATAEDRSAHAKSSASPTSLAAPAATRMVAAPALPRGPGTPSARSSGRPAADPEDNARTGESTR